MPVKNRKKQPTYEDYALATTPAEDVLHGEPVLTYDYSQLDPELGPVAMAKAQSIKRAERRTIENMVQIGRDLQDLQARFPHGMFLPWITQEFGWSRAIAYNLINLAQHLPPSATLPTNIGLTALYQLTGAKVPNSALEEATARADAGETITTTTARTIAKKHKQAHTAGDDTSNGDASGSHQPPATSHQPPATSHQPASRDLITHLRRALPYLHDARDHAVDQSLDAVNGLISQLLQLVNQLEHDLDGE